MSKLLLEAKGLSKRFSGAVALEDVSFRLRAGEIHSLMGENGAGKSTLIKILSGIHHPDSGSIQLDGRVVTVRTNHEAQSIGISTVFQEVNLIPTLTVAENVYLGREPKRAGRIRYDEMADGARKALARLDLDIDVTCPLEDFPIAIQQMVAIARALDLDAKVLILDEATSSLDRSEVESLFSVLHRLRREGLGIVFISHFLDQIYEICDRVTVLRNGRLVGEWQLTDLSRTELVSKMMGRELTETSLRLEGEDHSASKAKTWLEARAFGRDRGSAGALGPLELTLREGETYGIAGLLGSGRTEVLRLLFGLDRASEGELRIDGERVHFGDPQASIENGFAMVPEDRKQQSIFPGLSVRENIVLALQTSRGWASALSRVKQEEIAEKFIAAMGIKTRDAEQPIETLSGGNQQKAIIARWLALEPRLLLLDEPTRGIDVGAKAEILKLVRELSEKGKTVVFVSSELEEIVRVCDRVAVMRDRQKITEIARKDLTEEAVMSAIGEAR